MGSVLDKRQLFVEDDPNETFSTTAFAVKWAVLGGLFLLLLIWLGGGYYHAQRRMKRGLPPLKYHQWMISYEQRKRFEPALQNQFSFYRAQETSVYKLESFPPPVYDPNHVRPPAYQMPHGASKVNPMQDYDVPPLGLPPRDECSRTSQQNGVLGSAPPTAHSARLPWARKLNPFK